MLKQVPTASNVVGKATAVGGAKQAPDGGWKATDATVTAPIAGDLDRRSGTEAAKTPCITRTQAEVRYSKTLEDINKHLILLEKNHQTTTNTRGDIKKRY